MTVSQKILCCFLLSALLLAGIAALAVPGIFENYGSIVSISAQVLLFAATFITLFFIIFFCLNLRSNFAARMRPPNFTSAGLASAEAVQVEPLAGLGGNFCMFRQPFAFLSGNPELLQGAEGEVVYEEDGIHYINNNVFASDERGDGFDSNFAELVESVVNKKELVLE